MFKVPDWYVTMSVGLSEVLEEIGVNERIIMKRRRALLLMGNMESIENRLSGTGISMYNLGSQAEGTTTIGLNSDIDHVACADQVIIIQDWSEWTPGLLNLLMIQDETTLPGYCLLQVLRLAVPLPITDEYENFMVRDTHGRILYKNTFLDTVVRDGQRHGPAGSITGRPGLFDEDRVFAFPFKSWPRAATHWLNQQQGERWLTEDMKMYIQTTKCFVVGVGNKAGANEEFEWRISTSLAERCLMFNLNITQIRCYILMKMILKTYINPHHTGCLSSFMCKTVLLHCIKSKHPNKWQENNLLACLSYCLLTLHNCVSCAHCPHFIIKQNNLMAGKFSYQEKKHLLELTSNLRENIAEALLGIRIDDLGLRLGIQLNIVPRNQYNILYSAHIVPSVTGNLFSNTAKSIAKIYEKYLLKITGGSLNMSIQLLFPTMFELIRCHREGTKWEKTACTLLAPQFCTTLGSMLASFNIHHENTVSPEALAWLSAGLGSDVASSRLKLASVYFCTGDTENAASILRHTEERYTECVEGVCGCYGFQRSGVKEGFCLISNHSYEDTIKHVTAFCARFLPSEINCVPYELQYEIFRCTGEDPLNRNTEKDAWMDCAVVDSLPYLYFLQYKTSRHLQRNERQRHALNNLARAIKTEPNLGHRETALNLLGKCMEQENQPRDAFRCYILSLKLRPRNNAAKIHICVLLSKLMNSNV